VPSPLAPLVEPHPPPCLHRGRLDSRVGVLQAVPQSGVLGCGEPVVRLPLQGGELRGQVRKLSGEVLGSVPIISWSAHTIRYVALAKFRVIAPVRSAQEPPEPPYGRAHPEGIMGKSG
jgi:hypothetical protein